ncbi:MAG: acyl-CoA thioesterase [Microbacteriaceae bacterium]|jgi:acyl-CoA thioester hydrolase|nr:acyl-CoA thioesterase [Microbacteriaceae bacterium]MCI1207019.1 acyl-CoA thioesterase [Microbacteriaceae bacterium]
MRVTTEIPVRWSDIDAYGHINNVSALEISQEARVGFFRRVHEDGGVLPWHDHRAGVTDLVYVVHQEIEYVRSMPDPLGSALVDVWITRIDPAGLELAYEIYGPEHDRPYTIVANTVAVVDAETGRPRRLTERERETASQYLDEPLRFRHRERGA